MKAAVNGVARRWQRPCPGPGGEGAFSLIELMVALAVLGIILAVAIPNYRQWVIESGRAEAKSILMQGAQTLERCFTRYSSYSDAACPLGAGDTLLSENGRYQLTVSAVSATDFTLTAAPQGGQTEDTECGNFTLTAAGVRGISGTGNVEDCW